MSSLSRREMREFMQYSLVLDWDRDKKEKEWIMNER